MLCIFGSNTLVPIGLSCKKQPDVSHSRTEAETISLDAGQRLEGIPALNLWDMVIDVLEPPAWSNSMHNKSRKKKSLMAEKRMTCIPDSSR